MSVLVMSQVWALDVERPWQVVLMALADHGDDDGGNVYPSLGYVAWKTGYSERQVKRIMAELRAQKVLVQVQAAYRDRPARYRLDLTRLPRKAPYRGKPSGGAGRGSRERGAILTPLSDEAAATPAPEDGGGVTPAAGGVTPGVERGVTGAERGDISGQRGDIAVSPKPSVEPSREPPGEPSGEPPPRACAREGGANPPPRGAPPDDDGPGAPEQARAVPLPLLAALPVAPERPAAETAAAAAWAAVLARLAEQLPEPHWRRYLAETRGLELETSPAGPVLRAAPSSPLHLPWLEGSFGARIAAAVAAELGPGARVVWAQPPLQAAPARRPAPPPTGPPPRPVLAVEAAG